MAAMDIGKAIENKGPGPWSLRGLYQADKMLNHDPDATMTFIAVHWYTPNMPMLCSLTLSGHGHSKYWYVNVGTGTLDLYDLDTIVPRRPQTLRSIFAALKDAGFTVRDMSPSTEATHAREMAIYNAWPDDGNTPKESVL